MRKGIPMDQKAELTSAGEVRQLARASSSSEASKQRRGKRKRGELQIEESTFLLWSAALPWGEKQMLRVLGGGRARSTGKKIKTRKRAEHKYINVCWPPTLARGRESPEGDHLASVLPQGKKRQNPFFCQQDLPHP